MVSVADQTGADVVAAGVLLLGPKESGIRVVGGFLPENLSACDPISVPPSAILHRLDVARAVGGWNLPDDCVLAPDMDFLKRCWEFRRKVACTRRLSVIDINASWRPNSYITRDASDQEEWLGRIENEKGLLENEFHDTLACLAAGNLSVLGPIVAPPASMPKGWSAARMRQIRGIYGQAVGREEVPGGVRFTADHHGLTKGWYFPEASPDSPPFRWTGPGTQSVCEFTGIPPECDCVRIRLAGALAEDQLAISIKINGTTVPLQRENHPPGALFEGRLETVSLIGDASRVELTVPGVIRPRDLNPDSPDHRALGVRFSWIEFLNSSFG
jgi:hypothetical protein